MMQGETSKFKGIIYKVIEDYFNESINSLSIIDIGCGCDPLTENCDTLDQPTPYTDVNTETLTYVCDARCLSSVVKKSYQVIYSSHLLEDFEDTKSVLYDWLTIAQDRSLLVLLLPDQARYTWSCLQRNVVENANHKLVFFGLPYVKGCLLDMGLTMVCEKEFFNRDNLSDLEYNFLIAAHV